MEEFRTTQNDASEEVYSESVRAGKRTYFFDVKATKGNDYYITVTESRRKMERDGTFSYEKHKIFLYKEDFDKVEEAFAKAIAFVKENKKEYFDALANEEVEAAEGKATEGKAVVVTNIDAEFDAL